MVASLFFRYLFETVLTRSTWGLQSAVTWAYGLKSNRQPSKKAMFLPSTVKKI